MNTCSECPRDLIDNDEVESGLCYDCESDAYWEDASFEMSRDDALFD